VRKNRKKVMRKDGRRVDESRDKGWPRGSPWMIHRL
jgi:hypothetical protein